MSSPASKRFVALLAVVIVGALIAACLARSLRVSGPIPDSPSLSRLQASLEGLAKGLGLSVVEHRSTAVDRAALRKFGVTLTDLGVVPEDAVKISTDGSVIAHCYTVEGGASRFVVIVYARDGEVFAVGVEDTRSSEAPSILAQSLVAAFPGLRLDPITLESLEE